MRQTLLLLGVFFLFNILPAQVETETINVNSNIYDETKLLYRNEGNAGLIATSHGLGINYRRGFHVTNARKRVFEIEGVSYRHPKEVKITNEYFDHPKGYYYGKLNSLFILRPGVGYQTVFYSKPEHNGIEIRWIAFVGVSLGFAKPVYLEVLELTPISGERIITTVKYDPAIHFIDNIYGRAAFKKGITETKIYPGGYLKLGLNFEYGSLDTETKSIETGLTIDAYPKTIPIMANELNSPILFSLYLNFNFGRKWY